MRYPLENIFCFESKAEENQSLHGKRTIRPVKIFSFIS